MDVGQVTNRVKLGVEFSTARIIFIYIYPVGNIDAVLSCFDAYKSKTSIMHV
jgi:hypothetical protein